MFEYIKLQQSYDRNKITVEESKQRIDAKETGSVENCLKRIIQKEERKIDKKMIRAKTKLWKSNKEDSACSLYA